MARLSNLLVASSLLVTGVLLLPQLSNASPAGKSVVQSNVIERAASVQVTNITRLDLKTGQEVSITKGPSTDIRKFSDSLVGGLLVANTAIAAGVATCIAGTAALGTWGCLGIGAAALALNYLTVWLFGTTSVVKRSEAVFPGVTTQIHAAWVPVDGSECDTACLFLANAPANTWTALGNTTYADGTVVQIHAFHDGVENGVRGLQATVPSLTSSSTKGRRQIEDDYNSVTSQFYFYQEDQTSRNDFIADYDGNANDLANAIGTTISDWAADWDAAVMCGNFYDDDGFATDGLWTVDDGNNYYGLSTGTVESYLNACQGI